MFTVIYVSGKGYTVRDSRGRVIGHGLTPAQRDKLLAMQACSVITSQMLLAVLG